jgi:hypothetical protein
VRCTLRNIKMVRLPKERLWLHGQQSDTPDDEHRYASRGEPAGARGSDVDSTGADVGIRDDVAEDESRPAGPLDGHS